MTEYIVGVILGIVIGWLSADVVLAKIGEFAGKLMAKTMVYEIDKLSDME